MKRFRFEGFKKKDEEVKIDKTKIDEVRDTIEKSRLTSYENILKHNKKKRLLPDLNNSVSELLDILGDVAMELYDEFEFPSMKVLHFYISNKFCLDKKTIEKIISIEHVVEVKIYPTLPIDTLTLEIHLTPDEDFKSFYIAEDLEKMDDIKLSLSEGNGLSPSKGTKIVASKLGDIFSMDSMKRPQFPESKIPSSQRARFFLAGQVTLPNIKKCLSDRTFTDFFFKRDTEKDSYFIEVVVPAIGDFKEGFKL